MALTVWVVMAFSVPQALGTEAEALEHFETQVRPVLADNCFSCHSHQAEKVKGGLLLDTREGILKGGDSGPAIVVGDPDNSLLIKAVRYSDENLQMPPKNKRLSPGQVAALEAWVKARAPMPSTPIFSSALGSARGKKHWAFQPVVRPEVPTVQHPELVQEPIDNFVLAKLEAKGLALSPRADGRTLLRRAYYDLIGLPPTAEEVADFLQDSSPDAFAKVVDRLLASPQYGERWARYWLDVARYADTKGYVFEEERRYPYAYTFRDYVIRAFNEDLPYNRFLVEQLAADQLPLGDDRRPLAALGYLTLGRRFLNNQPDIIDDRIDVVTRGMMGLTVACARCHDHKYDPIPTKDYYSLYGVFASCSEPEELPSLGLNHLPPHYADYLKEHQRRLDEFNQFRQLKETDARAHVRQSTGQYLLAAYDISQLQDKSKAEAVARERKLNPHTAQLWASRVDEAKAEPVHPVLGPWIALAQCNPDEFTEDATDVVNGLLASDDGQSLNPFIVQAITNSPLSSILELADRYGGILGDIDRLWEAQTNAPTPILAAQSAASPTVDAPSAGAAALGTAKHPPAGFGDASFEQVRQVLYADASPAIVPEEEITRLFDVPSIQKYRALKRHLEELDATHPGAPPRAMALQDNAVPETPHVFLRGNPANPGPEVSRHFLSLLSQGEPKPFTKGSGRLELAQAIASRDNPLTARVLVNRVWLHYFGVGLVRTPSDFGLRSDPPSNPELLDYLAARFMDEGWSLKKLHRWIVLSRVYEQGTDDNPAAAQIDPGNQLLWRMNRRRLDFEALRDSLLAVSGKLDLTSGGHAVEITIEPFTPRRTVYGFVERQNLPGLFRTFDFASPDTTSPQRFTTTVPQQALFMLNSPFVAEQARLLTAGCSSLSGLAAEARVRKLYRTVYEREPNAHELSLALAFLARQGKVDPFVAEPEVWQYGYGQYDWGTRTLRDFHPLPHFTGDAWQGSDQFPDPQLGQVQLRAGGGQPGGSPEHAAVRRWIAPRAVTVSISGTLQHDKDKGDGIQAWIISSRSGQLATWTLKHGKEETHLEDVVLEQGDTLDFVVDGRADAQSDAFSWAPVIRAAGSSNDPHAPQPAEWDARQDFSGPKAPSAPLDPWQRFAQVLLMANEFVFLD